MKKVAILAAALIGCAGMAFAGADVDPKERLRQLANDGSYEIAQTCSGGGLKVCYAGSIAGGGCYNPSVSRCLEGMICPIGFSICTVDQKGYPTPYCYEPSKPNTCRN